MKPCESLKNHRLLCHKKGARSRSCLFHFGLSFAVRLYFGFGLNLSHMISQEFKTPCQETSGLAAESFTVVRSRTPAASEIEIVHKLERKHCTAASLHSRQGNSRYNADHCAYTIIHVLMLRIASPPRKTKLDLCRLSSGLSLLQTSQKQLCPCNRL